MHKKRLLLTALAALNAACGGEPSGPTPLEVHDVVAVVFYDINGNGQQDAGEVGLGGAKVDIAGRTALTEKQSGRAVVTGVPAGSQTAQIRSLPPFYDAGSALAISVPQPAGHDVLLPATLPIGSNQPETYMAFGDSITVGDGSTDGMGYRGLLQVDLEALFGRASVIDQGVEATRSNAGAERIDGSLAAVRPAYTLIHYGVNDWNDFECKTAFPCFTVDSLRSMIRSCKAAQSLPVLATIIPGNPSSPKVPPSRNDWVHNEDALIRPMAMEEGAVLADLEAAFLAHGDLPSLFSDHVHPNDAGYRIMADVFFKAISEAVPVAASAAIGQPEVPAFGFAPPRLRTPSQPRAGARTPRHQRN